MSDVPEDLEMDLDDTGYDSEEESWPGPTRTWTTSPQWAWLKRTRPPYLAARKAKRRAVYLEGMYTEYLAEWSECQQIYGHRNEERLSPEEKEVLADAVKKRKKQLLVWHKNRDRKRASTRKLSSLLNAVGISKKGGRLPQAQEVFSSEYYKTDVQPLVRSKTKVMEAELGRKLDPKERLNNVKRCTKEAFDACSDEVKREIKNKVAQAKEDAENGRAGRAVSPDTTNRTPQQFQDAIDLAPQLFEGVIKPYAAASGWTWSVVGAGPLPDNNGKIGHMSAHFGHNEGGVSFAQANIDFEEQCVVPMGRFAKRVFPRDVQEQRSLQAARQASQEDTRSPELPNQQSNLVPSLDVTSDFQNGESSCVQQSALRTSPSGVPSAAQSTQAVLPPVVPSNALVPVGPSIVAHVVDPLAEPSNVIDPLTLMDDPGLLEPGYDEFLAARINSMGRASVDRMLESFAAADPYTFEEFVPELPDWATPLLADPADPGQSQESPTLPVVQSKPAGSSRKRRAPPVAAVELSAHKEASSSEPGGTDAGSQKRRSPRGHATGGTKTPVAVAVTAQTEAVSLSAATSSETGGSRQLRSARSTVVPQKAAAITKGRKGGGTKQTAASKKAAQAPTTKPKPRAAPNARGRT
ncbi:hypothetical protein K466DRAFT_606731 [Polyporus arcularius HHB13444]|uniref:Uncharacterized protein n=1 Tax=Polyporus arcularius HHB13444 TaxID=1314778 RepID=A0A5C3NQR3_9APHY|nr:hypothetical protein K466DRAFT_606731 [Polyporus arcularius HHB13444]